VKIIVDFDSTIVKTHEAVLALYREITGDMSTEVNDKAVEWNMGGICPEWTKEEVEEVFVNPRLFELLEPIKDAVEVLQRLHDNGHYIEICSMHRKEGIPFKEAYIKKHLPMVDKITILPFESTNKGKKFDKSSVVGDIIVDDRIDALESSKCKYKICYGVYNWNKEWQGMRVDTWEDLYAGIDSIHRAIIKGDL
jgi:5'(3')-deoxyribonucleotidase